MPCQHWPPLAELASQHKAGHMPDEYRQWLADTAPLATEARWAPRHAGQCHLCGSEMARGIRIAQLPTGEWAHVPCIAASNVSAP